MSFGSRSLPPPTPDELERWAKMKEDNWCIACGEHVTNYVQIHHLLSKGGLRLGHRYSVSLCLAHHANVKERWFKKEWPNQYILDKQDERIRWPWVQIPDKRERRKASSAASPRKARIGVESFK